MSIVGRKEAGDALITKKGDFIRFDPQDNILATKSPVMQGPRGAIASAGSPMGSSGPQVVQVNLHLDGKKIAESQVRIATSGVG